jgi:NAD(P)-dependent dehydrogenase (short-subunit alcohol dehydrogenase family)
MHWFCHSIPYGITVNAVAPGVIETEMLHSAHWAEGIRQLASEIPPG